MVWAQELTHDGIWDAIKSRRTYAVTGNRIMLATSIDGNPMGVEYTSAAPREISVEVLGGDIVGPSAEEPKTFSFSRWDLQDARRVSFSTETLGNPNVVTDATQQMALHVIGDKDTVLSVTFNGRENRRSVGELLRGPQTEYLGGFLTGAMLIHRAVPYSARYMNVEMTDAGSGSPRDRNFARVRQHNDQDAWGSPTFVARESC